jgi:hypothetical protein
MYPKDKRCIDADDDTVVSIDEEWLEEFVRKIIDKVLNERCAHQSKSHDRWIYTENK